MKKRGIDKGISAAGTILFVGLIQTTAPAWSLVILALIVYEIAQWCCRIARRGSTEEPQEAVHYRKPDRCRTVGKHMA